MPPVRGYIVILSRLLAAAKIQEVHLHLIQALSSPVMAEWLRLKNPEPVPI
jgi:hypothetical protein